MKKVIVTDTDEFDHEGGGISGMSEFLYIPKVNAQTQAGED